MRTRLSSQSTSKPRIRKPRIAEPTPPDSPEPSEPPTGSIDSDKPEEREEEANESRMVVDQHEIQEGEDPESVTVARPTRPYSLRSGGSKSKKGASKSNQQKAAMEKNLQTLLQNFKAIPFEPSKPLEFSKHEELLKRAGLWDFAHVKFDRNLRKDLIGQLIVNYKVTKRGSYVEGHKIMVNRSDLGRALHLVVKKPGAAKGDAAAQETTWPEEFLSFVKEFVSSRMLLHADMWEVPEEILSWNDNIKDGHLEKVDWASLVWFMVEKEVSQGINLKECYYAPYLQHLIKAQKKELFHEDGPEGVEEVLMVKDDADEGDVKMEELSHEKPNMSEQTTGPQSVASTDNSASVQNDVGDVNVGDDDNMCVDNDRGADSNAGIVNDGVNAGGIGNVEDTSGGGDGCMVKMMTDVEATDHEVGDVRNIEGAEHQASDVGNVEGTGHEAGDVGKVEGSVHDAGDVGKVEDSAHDTGDEGKVEGVGHDVADVGSFEGTDHDTDDVVKAEGAGDDTDQIKEEMDTDVMNFDQPRVEEQNHWFLAEKSNEEGHFLQPCSGIGSKAAHYEQAERANNVGDHLVVEDDDDDDAEGDEHAGEDYETLQKCDSFNGMSPGNFMQPLESSQMVFASSSFDSQPSLELISSRVDHQAMLGAPTMLRNGNKRSIEHEPEMPNHDLNNSHVATHDSNKRIRTDGPWDSKVPDFESCIGQVNEWLGKARLSHAASRERAIHQASVNQDMLLNELAAKDHVIHQLRSSLEEVQQMRRAEGIRFDNELSVMGSLIDGYRRALKDREKAFSDYRRRVGLHEEPLYKDAGEGGVVKSLFELERERLAREEEERMTRLRTVEWVKKTTDEWEGIFEGYYHQIEMLGGKLLDLAQERDIIRERIRMRMASETADEAGSAEKTAGEAGSAEKTACSEENTVGEAALDEEMADRPSLDEKVAGEAACDEEIAGETNCDEKTGVEDVKEEKARGDAASDEKTTVGEAASDEKTTVGEAASDEKTTAGEAASDEKTTAGEAASDEKTTAGEEAASDEKTGSEAAASDGETPGEVA